MHGKQKRFHAPFFVGKRRFMEQTEKQTMDKEQCPHIKKNRKNHLQRGNSFQQNEQGNHDG